MFRILTLTLLLVAPTLSSNPTSYRIGEFDSDWQEHWKKKRLSRRSNTCDVVIDGDVSVLRIVSDGSASGVVRKLKVEPIESGSLSWRWKVERSLTENAKELEKKGDDYAACMCVIYETHFFRWRTKMVCYVWAGNEPVGALYRSPHSRNVATIVVESGDEKAGMWVVEERDVVEDYKRYFGEAPKKVSGFTIIVDTDQTRAKTTAWFDDVVFESGGGDAR